LVLFFLWVLVNADNVPLVKEQHEALMKVLQVSGCSVSNCPPPWPLSSPCPVGLFGGGRPMADCNGGQLVGLHALQRNLTGVLPTELGLLTSMEHLTFGGNPITGRVHSELALLTRLTFLSLRQTNLTGTIPKEFSRLTALTTFHVFSTVLSGLLPPFNDSRVFFAVNGCRAEFSCLTCEPKPAACACSRNDNCTSMAETSVLSTSSRRSSETTALNATAPNADDLGLIAGLVVGSIVAILLITLAVALILRARHKPSQHVSQTPRSASQYQAAPEAREIAERHSEYVSLSRARATRENQYQVAPEARDIAEVHEIKI
jgi:hypothetical protein